MADAITREAMRGVVAHVGEKYAPADLDLDALARELERWRDVLADFECFEDRAAASAQLERARQIESAARRLSGLLTDSLGDAVLYGENVSRLFSVDGLRREGRSRRDWPETPTCRARFATWIAELAVFAAADAETIERRRQETGSPALWHSPRSLRESVIGAALPELFEETFRRPRKGQICFRFIEAALRVMEIKTPYGGWYQPESIKSIVCRIDGAPRRRMVRKRGK